MTKEQFKIFCGAFEQSENSEAGWLERFLRVNIEALCKVLFPGETAYLLVNNTKYFDTSTNLHMPLEYIPLVSGIPQYNELSLDTVDCHCFVLRQGMLQSERVAAVLKDCSVHSVITAWSLIGYSLRYALQLRYAKKLNSVPFSVLSAFGVDGSNVQDALLRCIQLCEDYRLFGDHRIRYMDRSALACLVASPLQLERDRIAELSKLLMTGIQL